MPLKTIVLVDADSVTPLNVTLQDCPAGKPFSVKARLYVLTFVVTTFCVTAGLTIKMAVATLLL